MNPKRKLAQFFWTLILLAGFFLVQGALDRFGISVPGFPAPAKPADISLQEAFRKQSSDIQVTGAGSVIRILADDLDGSRHQRFIVKLDSGQTLAIAHNIDLAPRIQSLQEGDLVEFHGEYEWNSKGGVIHWTHHDPDGRHPGGWLKHAGKTYQ